MSASRVVGTDPEIAMKLDNFWNKLSRERRACLHTAFNLSQKRKGYETTEEETLMNAESGRNTVSSVRADFFRFLEKNVENDATAETILKKISYYGQLSAEEQESYISS